MLDQKKHRRLHDFHDVDMPCEQIARILEIARPALQPKAIREIKQCIDDW